MTGPRPVEYLTVARRRGRTERQRQPGADSLVVRRDGPGPALMPARSLPRSLASWRLIVLRQRDYLWTRGAPDLSSHPSAGRLLHAPPRQCRRGDRAAQADREADPGRRGLGVLDEDGLPEVDPIGDARHVCQRAAGEQRVCVRIGLSPGCTSRRRQPRTTVEQWCATWLAGYATRRPSTVRQARVHIRQIVKVFGPMRLGDVRPSQVKAWTSRMKAEGLADSYVYATYRRLAQIMGDAVHDGLLPRSPCSRRDVARPRRVSGPTSRRTEQRVGAP